MELVSDWVLPVGVIKLCDVGSDVACDVCAGVWDITAKLVQSVRVVGHYSKIGAECRSCDSDTITGLCTSP